MLPAAHARRWSYLRAVSSNHSQNSGAAGKTGCAVPFADRGAASNPMTRPITLYQTGQNDNDLLNEVILEARERLEKRLRTSSTSNRRDSHVRWVNNREQVYVGGLIAEARQPSELCEGPVIGEMMGLAEKDRVLHDSGRRSWDRSRSKKL